MVKTLFGQPVAVAPAVNTAANSLVQYKPITLEEISGLGGNVSKAASAVSDKITQSARTVDMDELGKLMLDTVKKAQGYDPSNMKKGFLNFFKSKIKDFQLQFDKVDDTIKRNVAEINKKSALFRQRITDIDTMQKQLKADKQSLLVTIQDVLARVQWMEANVPAVTADNLDSAQYKQNWIMAASMGAKRADDLKRLVMLLDQQDAMMDQMKQNAAALAQKMSDLQTTSVPAMKLAFQNYILQMEMRAGAEFADAQDALTNRAIEEAAKLHGQNTTAIMTSVTRSNIELSTLQAGQQSIITSLQESERILSEMKSRLKSEAPQLEQLSADLCAQLSR